MTTQENQAYIESLANVFRNPWSSPFIHLPEEVGLKYENCFFPSEDGTALDAWYIPRPGSNKLIIVNHPLRCNRSGYPLDVDPWKTFLGGSAFGNDLEMNFIPDLKIIHDAGYNILAYDLRSSGTSASANGGISGTSVLESRDVIGSINYVRSREDTKDMIVGLFSRCLGGNATIIAMGRRPEVFKDIRCLLFPNPASRRPLVERLLEAQGIPEQFEAVDSLIKRDIGYGIDELSALPYAKSVRVPTFIYAVKEDLTSKPTDAQGIYDAIPIEDKKLLWLDGKARVKGYLEFQKNPKVFVDWLNERMV